MAQNEIHVQKLFVDRPDPTSVTTPVARESVEISALVSSTNVISYTIDATAGTVAAAFTLPADSLLMYSTLNVSEVFAGGTTVEVGTGGSVAGITSATTPGVGATLNAGALVGTITGGDINITVTGTYTTGTAVVNCFYLESTKNTDDTVVRGGSETVTQ